MSESDRFGGWSIDQKVFGWILSNLQVGSQILELGSGWATGELSRYYRMHSIEDSINWVNKYDSHYIYAPGNGWYDMAVLDQELGRIDYNLFIIDGPENFQRQRIVDNARVFNWAVPVIIDDCQEPHIMQAAETIAKDFCKRPSFLITGEQKKAMVIP